MYFYVGILMEVSKTINSTLFDVCCFDNIKTGILKHLLFFAGDALSSSKLLIGQLP